MAANTANLPAQTLSSADQSRQEESIVNYVMDRFNDSERFDRPFKNRCLDFWKQANSVLDDDWPYFTQFFEPATQTAINDIQEGVMAQMFQKDAFFDLIANSSQDEVSTECYREVMKYVYREKYKYKVVKYYQFLENTMFGNGVQKHIAAPNISTFRSSTPIVANDVIRQVIGRQEVVERQFDVWPKGYVVSRFDMYPARTGATIQEMPYFIQRAIVPVHQVRAMAKYSGYRNTDKIDGYFSLNQANNTANGNWDVQHFDLYERLRAVGYDITDKQVGETISENCVKYCELLFYYEASPSGEGCSRVIVVADQKWLLQDQPNPYYHGKKPFSEIKFRPRNAQVWQARGIPELVEQIQRKINTRMSQVGDIIELIRSPQTWVGAQAGVEDLSDLEEHPGSIVRVNDPLAISQRTRPGVPEEILREIDYSNASFQRATGVSDYSRGIAGSTTGLNRGSETARGMSLLMQASNQAKTFQMMMAEDGLTDGIQIDADIVQQTMTVPQKIRILNDNDKLMKMGVTERNLIVTPEEIEGRWKFYVVGLTKTLDSAQLAEAIVNAFTQGMQLPDVGPRLRQLDGWMEVMELNGLRNPQRFVMNDEEFQQKQQQMQQSAMAQLLQEVFSNAKYKDLPPDIQATLEQAAGIQPSQLHALQMRQLSAADRIQQMIQQMSKSRQQERM